VLTRQELGARGERAAADHLRRLGYRLLATNYRCALGELDLIAQDGPETVFVEVKARRSGPDDLAPEESVTPAKAARLARLAEVFLVERGKPEALWRIDVVAVILEPSGLVRRIEHLRNAVY
jgi:putative endonuclease